MPFAFSFYIIRIIAIYVNYEYLIISAA
jgi:hypothetical protein